MDEYVLNSLEEGIIIFDRQDNLRFCNESVLQKLGYKLEELIGTPISRIIFSESKETLKIHDNKAQIKLYIKSLHHKRIQVRCKMLEGEWRGETVYWIIINEYQEKKYKIEELEYILDSIPFGVWISDEKDHYKYVNSYIFHTLRSELDIDYAEKEIIDSQGINVWKGYVDSEVLKKDLEILARGKVICEDRGIEQGDRKISYHLIKVPIIDKENGFKGYVGIIECNIFQENLEELILAIGANKNSHIMSVNKIGKRIKELLIFEDKTARMIGSDTLFICKYVQENKKLKCICQIGEEQTEILQSLEMKMDNEIYSAFIQRQEWNVGDLEKYLTGYCFNRLKALGINYLRIIPIDSGNENMAVMVITYKEQPHCSAMEIRNSQNLCKYIGTLLKNSQLSLEINKEFKKRQEVEEERLTYKEALEMESLKNEFMNNMSHELKTPLNIIYSMLQLVECELEKGARGKLSEIDQNKLKKYRQVSKQNIYRLLRLINNITEVSHIGAGYYSIKRVNCNVVKIIEDTTMAVIDYIKNKKLNIIFDTEVEELRMGCDPEKIERIILNLLSNAVKYTDEGGSIRVNLEVKEGNLVILVKDNGIGIPKDKQANIFERFVQVDTSFTRKHEGSGIGLTLVKCLVELHNGSVDVESELGKGSVFIVKIPIKAAEEELTLDINVGNALVEKCRIEFSDIYNI